MRNTKTTIECAIAAGVFLIGWASGVGATSTSIIFIMADDLGWMDLHCQGNDRVDTPHLDQFAQEGMRFTDAYAAAPVCSPTRAAVLTGLAPARLQITNHIPDQKRFVPEDAELLPAPMLNHLPASRVTIAERLREKGYATAFLGKWHLAGRAHRQGLGDARYYPEEQGFDSNVGGCALGGPPSYFDPYRIHNLKPRKAGEYLPDRLTDEAITFIKGARQKPFLLFLWLYTVHWPMEAPAKLVEKYKQRKGPGLRDHRYGAMIEAMDAAVGRLLASVDALGLAPHTLVVFTSDNGGFSGVADNRPLRSGKGHLYEGGIRVPLMVRWPGVVPAGTQCSTPVTSMDFYATFLEVAGLTSESNEAQDGRSLMPLFRGSKELEREALYFHYPNYAWHRSNRLGGAIRAGDFKLIENFDDGSVELYDLKHDLGETRNLASEKPEKARELRRKLRAWRASTGAAMPVRVKPKSGGKG